MEVTILTRAPHTVQAPVLIWIAAEGSRGGRGMVYRGGGEQGGGPLERAELICSMPVVLN